MQNKSFSSVVIYTPEKFDKRHQVSTSAAILLRMLFTQKFCTFFCKLGNFYALLQGHLTWSNKKLIYKLFVQHSSGDKCWNEAKKSSIDFVIKHNEDDWMFERSITTHN